MTGEQAMAAFTKADALVKLGMYAEARAVDLLPSDRVVIEQKIASATNAKGGSLMFTGRDVKVMTRGLWNTALEDAALVCEKMRPHGGMVFTEEQAACFAALSDAAASIRKLKRGD